jgi:putative oxidoreductase
LGSKSGDARGSLGLLALRVGAGLMLLLGHGLPKLLHFSQRAAHFADPLHVGSPASLTLVVFAEVVCSTLVVLGLWTRLAVIPIIVFLGVAIFVQHGGGPFADRELAMIYVVPFIAIALMGPGAYAVDARGAGR